MERNCGSSRTAKLCLLLFLSYFLVSGTCKTSIRRPRRGHQACGSILVSGVFFWMLCGVLLKLPPPALPPPLPPPPPPHHPSCRVFQSDMPQNPWNVYFLETKSPCGVAPNTEEGLRIYLIKLIHLYRNLEKWVFLKNPEFD